MQQPPQNPPRDHHFIPQLVQRGFSTNRSTVVGVRRPAAPGRPYLCLARMPIKTTAMVRDFNVVEGPNQHVVATLESAISKHVETPAANALRAITQASLGPLSLTTPARRAVGVLAGLLHANSPQGRARLQGHLATFAPVGGASTAAIQTMARAVAFDRNDAAEVGAWEQALIFMRDGNTAVAHENLLRLTILLGQMTGSSFEKMSLTVYRLDAPPFFILPDLPVLGSGPPGGDIPDPGSFALFPFEHRHLLVFDADATQDEIRAGNDPRLGHVLRQRFPTAPSNIVGARGWASLLAYTSMASEAYALRAEDIKAAALLSGPPAPRILLKTTAGARGQGVALL